MFITILELNKYKGDSQESDNHFVQDLYQQKRKYSLKALTNVSSEDALLYTAAPARFLVLVLLETMFFPHRRTSLQ